MSQAMASRNVEIAYSQGPVPWVVAVSSGLPLKLIGIAVSYAEADKIVEFVRPIPPLALIPLVILWLGVASREVFLLSLVAFFIIMIAARVGVSSIGISKVHAASFLGASKAQVLPHVILPNALPEIFIGLAPQRASAGTPRSRPG